MKNPDDKIKKYIKLSISSFTSKLSDRWKKCGRTRTTFLNSYSSWLDEDFSLSQEILNKKDDNQNKNNAYIRRGRPCKNFEAYSLKSKRNKIKNLLNTRSSEEICMAADMSL